MANGRSEEAMTAVDRAIVLGIELSKKSWLIALRSPLADRISLHRLAAGTLRVSWPLLNGRGRPPPRCWRRKWSSYRATRLVTMGFGYIAC
jgi:hypothetical protein